ncbi:radical SAM protein [Candidatus Woesearchaeota archaeon]|nr:radical SAM protein [Candidatus Woesearchaeota archaeon]
MVLKLEAHVRFEPEVHIDVYKTTDGHLIETAVFSGEGYNKNIVSITSQIGCPVGCSFCYMGGYDFKRNVSPKEYLQQVKSVTGLDQQKPMKVCFTRAGEPLLNPNTIEGIVLIAETFSPSFQLTSIMPATKNSRKLLNYLMGYLKGNKNSFQINVSMHTSDEEQRKKIIPFKDLMGFKEIAEFGEEWKRMVGNRKINLSFVLMEGCEIDLQKFKEVFNPEYFSIRFALYLPSSEETAARHPPSSKTRMEEQVRIAKELGYECIQSVPGPAELKWDTRPGCMFKLRR